MSAPLSGMNARTRLLVGDDGVARLARSRVIVFGLGGVGGAAAEQLCRAGVGSLGLVDFDVIREGNLNRQVFAVRSTLGRLKVEAATERLRDINPECRIEATAGFFGAENAESFALDTFDYVLDCIDSLNPKVQLLHHCATRGIRIITAAGAAAKTNPVGVRVVDLFQTRGDPLAKHVRRRLRGLGVREGIPAVHSAEAPVKLKGAPVEEDFYQRGRARAPVGSISYLPTIFGCTMAGWVIRHLLGTPLPLETP